MNAILAFLMEHGVDLVTGFTYILAGLKIFARYSKSDWDDKLLSAIEAPFQYLRDKLLPFLKK